MIKCDNNFHKKKLEELYIDDISKAFINNSFKRRSIKFCKITFVNKYIYIYKYSICFPVSLYIKSKVSPLGKSYRSFSIVITLQYISSNKL